MRKGILFAVTLAVLWVFFAWGSAWSQVNLWNDLNQKVLQEAISFLPFFH